MTSRFFRLPVVAAAALFLGGLGLPTAGHADTFGTVYNITYAGCCGSGPFGTVSVSGAGTTTLTIDADLSAGNFFADTGNGNTFQFSTSSAVTNIQINTASTTPVGDTVGTWAVVSGAVNPLDALGTFLSGLQCTKVAGTASCGSQDLFITVTLASAGNIIPETGGQHGPLAFGIDICQASSSTSACTATGPVGAPVPGPIVGAGLPGLIAACGGLIALARRRRQKLA